MKYYSLLLLVLFSFNLKAQDLDDLLNDATKNNTEVTTATFKSTRIILGHSIERMQKGQLDFRISHHFGKLNSGSYNLWGLDGPAAIHLSLEYGIADWVMVGAGRGNYEKTYDGFVKFSLLRQSKGEKNMPVSVSLLSTVAYNSLNKPQLGFHIYEWDRFSYVGQVLIARKFNERLSVEINPTLVHRNLVDTELDPNDVFSIGTGLRFKLLKRVSFNAEYYFVYKPLPDYQSMKIHDPLSLGFDIETGGHVFQLFISNSDPMIEKGFITETTGNWADGGIHFGFNISRVFSLKRTPK